MKTILWIVKLALFLIALTFAVKNTDSVTVRYYLGVEWQAPLIFVILVVFCLGVAAGVIASLGHVIRLRRELSRVRKQVPQTLTTDKQVLPSGSAASPNTPDVV